MNTTANIPPTLIAAITGNAELPTDDGIAGVEWLDIGVLPIPSGRHRGYWVDVRRHIDDVLTGLDPDQKTTTIRIPWSSKISVKSIDRFREMSLERMHLEG
jgi:hypothetical protein